MRLNAETVDINRALKVQISEKHVTTAKASTNS